MAKKTPKSSKTGNKRKPSNTPRKSQKTSGGSSTTRRKVVVAAGKDREEKSEATPTQRKTTRAPKSSPEAVLPFSRMNYILLAVGVAIIALGFFLMSLDDFVDATKFSISLYIAPIIVVAGFVEIIYAIMYKPKTGTTDTAASQQTAES